MTPMRERNTGIPIAPGNRVGVQFRTEEERSVISISRFHMSEHRSNAKAGGETRASCVAPGIAGANEHKRRAASNPATPPLQARPAMLNVGRFDIAGGIWS